MSRVLVLGFKVLGFKVYMSYSLNSLKGGYIGDYIWESYRGLQEDARSLDYSSHHIL